MGLFKTDVYKHSGPHGQFSMEGRSFGPRGSAYQIRRTSNFSKTLSRLMRTSGGSE